MKQILNKLVKQKTKTNRDIGKMYYNIEMNGEEINKNNKEIKTIKRAIRNRKSKNKKYDDFSLRISGLKKSISHYENDIIVLKNRIIEFEGLRSNINLKIKTIKQNLKLMKNNRVRCDDCKIDIHRALRSRHEKNKKHLGNISQNKVIVPRKNPIKRVLETKEVVKITGTNVENHYSPTDEI